jgi:hypothetical protein
VGGTGRGKAGGGVEEVVVDVLGEWAEDWVGTAVDIGGGGEMEVEAGDGLADGADEPLGGVDGPAGMLFLEGGEFFEAADGLSFDGLNLFGVIEESVEFFFLFEECAGEFGIVLGEAALLETGVWFELDGQAGGWVHDFGEAELLAVDSGDFGDEVDGVDGVLRGIQQQVGDEEDAALVFDDGEVAFEG